MSDTTRFAWSFGRYAALMLAVLSSVEAVTRWALGESWIVAACWTAAFVTAFAICRAVTNSPPNTPNDRRFARSHRVDVIDIASRRSR